MRKLLIYEVVSYGADHDPDGYDGVDTIFLVRAANVEEAVNLTLPRLLPLSGKFIKHKREVDIIYEIGQDLSVSGQAEVLRDVYFQHAYNRRWNSWQSSRHNKHWEAVPIVKNGIATAFYENGQKATEINYENWIKHGLTTRWFKNGKMMYCGEYVNGGFKGLHEYWHENGAKQMELIYNGKGVTVTEWFDDGEKMRDFTEDWELLKKAR